MQLKLRPTCVCACVIIRAFVADMDAHRQALGAKGSAGLKPCAYCRNCVAKESKAAGTGKFFSISEPDFTKFEEHTQQGLQAYLQQAMEKLTQMSKKDAEMTERCLGYRVEDKGVWFSPACASLLPLSKYVNDSMHIFFGQRHRVPRAEPDGRSCAKTHWQRHRRFTAHRGGCWMAKAWDGSKTGTATVLGPTAFQAVIFFRVAV